MSTNDVLSKLKAEIERRLKNVRDYMNGAGMKYKGAKYYKAQGKESAYDALLNILDSLQQEQPDCHTVEDWIQHIKNADTLSKDIFSKGPYDVLYDALNHPYQYCYDAIKEFGELCFQTGVNSVKQEQPCDTCTNDKGCVACKDGELWEGEEQPSEDFEKEVEWEWVHREKQEVDLIECAEMDKDEFVRFARHFYELGKQSREPVSEDLEEAAKEYVTTHLRNNEFPTADSAFIAGAEWKEEQDDKETTDLLAIAHLQGMEQQKKEMMKEVTECELVCFKDHLLAVLPMKEFRWTAGDKVKIIIVPQKEDKE